MGISAARLTFFGTFPNFLFPKFPFLGGEGRGYEY